MMHDPCDVVSDLQLTVRRGGPEVAGRAPLRPAPLRPTATILSRATGARSAEGGSSADDRRCTQAPGRRIDDGAEFASELVSTEALPSCLT